MDTSQIENMEKYNVGIPNIVPLRLNISTRGKLKKRSRAIDNTINFCSCLFFIPVKFN